MLLCLNYGDVFWYIQSRFYRADGKYPDEMSSKDITSAQFRAWSRAAAAA